MRILLVDDNHDIVRLVQRVLELEGHQVLIARDGIEALQQVASHRPDALVLDVNMPGMEGWEVCERVKKQYGTPVMMLTVRAERADVERGERLGADAYLAKPFDIPVFINTLQAMLRQSYPQGQAGEREDGDAAL